MPGKAGYALLLLVFNGTELNWMDSKSAFMADFILHSEEDRLKIVGILS